VRDFRRVPLSTFEALAVALGVDLQTTSAPDPELVTFFRAMRETGTMPATRAIGTFRHQRTK
jgi:hypothetical protein